VTTLPEGKVVKQIITGLLTSMIVTEDNRMINANDVKQIFASGSNEYGQLGLGDNTRRSTFTAVSSLPGDKIVKQVISRGIHTLCKAEDGTVFACGNNVYGQLGLADFGNNPSSFRETFAISSSLLNGQVIKEIVTGVNQTFLLVSNTDGTNVRVLACGENDFGQLGLGNDYTENILTQVPLR
jgi:alpha-tubulin suppressor-like RCC1 family protein